MQTQHTIKHMRQSIVYSLQGARFIFSDGSRFVFRLSGALCNHAVVQVGLCTSTLPFPAMIS